MAAIATAPTPPYVTLRDILGGPNLTRTVLLTVSGLPMVFDPRFYDTTDTSEDQTFQVTQYTGQRQTAPITSNADGVPAKLQLKELGARGFGCILHRWSVTLKASAYMNLLAYNSVSLQKKGIQEIQRQIKSEKTRMSNNRRVALASMLFNGGKTYIDNQGNFLSSSSGAQTTIDMMVPSSNTGQGTDPVTGNPIIDVPWDNPAADIVQQLTYLKRAGAFLTGYVPTTIYYSINIPQYLATNTSVQKYLSGGFYDPQGGPPGLEYLRTGLVPKNLFGFNWVPGFNQMWLDQNNVIQTFMPSGTDTGLIVAMPEYDNNWAGMAEGQMARPKQYGPITVDENGNPIDATFEYVPGQSAWAYVMPGTTEAQLVFQDAYLPYLGVPSALWNLTVSSGSFS